MPKPIKKKVSKAEVGAEESVRTFMSVVSEKIETNFKQFIIGAIAALAVVILAIGLFVYRGSSEKRAETAFYEGYKSYHGLFDAKVLTPVERNEKAFESFKKAYDIHRKPQTLLYIANAQHALGKDAEALKSLEELQQTFPENAVYVPLAMYKTAMIQAKVGNAEEALKTLDKLYGYKSDFYKDTALAESARLLETLGREAEAMSKYEAILKEFPGSPYTEEAKLKTGVEKETGEQKETTEKSGD